MQGMLGMDVVKMETPSIEQRMKEVKELELVRTFKCEFILSREEFKSGCGGMTCLHGCQKGLPAVPGIYCQKCTAYVKDEDNLPWLS